MADETDSYEILRLTATGSAYRRDHLTPGHLAVLQVRHEHEGSSVCLLRTADLDALLRTLPGKHIEDCGTKHGAKPLSYYLAGRPGLLALRTPYRDASQTLRGLRSLITTAAGHKARSAFFIGIGDEVFEELAARAEPAMPPGTATDDASAELRRLIGDTIPVPESLRHRYLGEAGPVEWVRHSIVLASRVPYPVLIQGETGTGKEIVARQIHDLSQRSAGPFVTVNCGGIPPELLESELFGHVRGAFTGAFRNKTGHWTNAAHGTLFLDEIGDLPLPHQVKVLRAVESGTYFPVGGVKEMHSGARVIAATNRDLAGMVQKGQFRDDLYYRLFNFRIRTPALREHPGDIPLLARHLWLKLGDGQAPALPAAVTTALTHCPWPGNVRELRAFLSNLLLVAPNGKVDVPLVHAVLRERLGGVLPAGMDA